MDETMDIKIAYQNKDIVSKIFGEAMKEKALKVYGLDVPKVIGVLPTNLPGMEVSEQRLDNLFLLEDGSYAIVEYESKYSHANKIKYIGYIMRLLRRLQKEGRFPGEVRIRLIILYTADVKPRETRPVLDVGAMQLVTEEAFLSRIDGTEELRTIAEKQNNNIPLQDEDLMKLILCPLTFTGKKRQRAAIRTVAQLAKNHIADEEQQKFVLSGLLTFSDKIIDAEAAEDIRRALTMTKVGRIIAEEMVAYGKKVEEEVREKVTEEVTESCIVKLILFGKEIKASAEDVVRSLVGSYSLTEEESWEKVRKYYPIGEVEKN